MSVSGPIAKGADNPFEEKSWEWKFNHGMMQIIHENETGLIVKREGETYDHIKVDIVSEEKGWAEMKITWDEEDYHGPKNYWNDHDIPDVDNLTFMVKKSTNMAYFKGTDEIFGYNPFYIYNYTDFSVLDGEENTEPVRLGLYRKMRFSKGVWSPRRGNSRKGYLNCYTPEDKVKFMRYPDSDNPRNYTISLLTVNSKGHYPVHFNTFIPAQYLIDNVTTEKYVRLTGVIKKEESPEVYEFLKTVDMSVDNNNDGSGGNLKSSITTLPDLVLIATIAVLVTISSIIGYLGYKNKSEKT